MSIKSSALTILSSYVYSDESDFSESEETSETNTASSCETNGVTSPSATETGSSPSRDSAHSESDEEFEKLLPPLTTQTYPIELQTKFDKWYEKSANGLNVNDFIQTRKDFRNPAMYTKLIQHCHIDEFGTNFQPDFFDPGMWGEESFYDNLAKDQLSLMEKLNAKRTMTQATQAIQAIQAMPVKKEVPVQIINGTSRKTSAAGKETFDSAVIEAKVAHAMQIASAVASRRLNNGADNNDRKMKLSL